MSEFLIQHNVSQMNIPFPTSLGWILTPLLELLTCSDTDYLDDAHKMHIALRGLQNIVKLKTMLKKTN